MDDVKREKRKARNQRIATIVGISVLIALIVTYALVNFGESPKLVEVHVEFLNGTKAWIHQENMESIVNQLKPNYEDFMTKTTDLKDGTVDYRFKHVDAIGAKPKLP